jgi:hypothetical protein
MRLAALLVIVAACRTEGGSIPTTARIRLLAGDTQVAPGVRVVAHRPDGEVIAEDDSDAVGIAVVGIETDSLITAQFPGYAMTTLPPPPDTTLEIHGPAVDKPLLVVGALNLDAPLLAGASGYKVDVGCVTLVVPQFPDSIDISACSQGSDQQLDLLVTAHDTTSVVGYAAARVPFIGGVANLAVSAWQPPSPLAVTLDVPASAAVAYFADGNAYDAGTPPLRFAGLETERTRVIATSGAATSTRYITGTPDAVAVTAANFLDAVPATLVRDGTTWSWAAAPVGDAMVLRDAARSWDVVLPSSVQSFTAPDGAAAFESYGFVDSSAVADFAELQTLGLWASTIVPVPDAGEIRTTFLQ